jgi:histidyl-tRNA synthetase
MASQVNPPRGMRDFVPREKAHRDRVLATIKSTYRAHGFDEIETPVMEDSSRLNAGLGGDNEKLAFGILKRGLGPDDFASAKTPLDLVDMGLRFDLTVPLARFYATHRAELPAVFRGIQIAPVWRAERPQKGRYRQFVQCDIDIIGEGGLIAEVELIAATLATLDALGLEGCQVRINDRRILTSMLGAFGFAPETFDSVLVTIDKLDKVGPDGVLKELDEKGHDTTALAEFFRRPTTMEYLPFGEAAIRTATPEGVDLAPVKDLATIGDSLGALAGRVVFDPFLVRGMGYYTGTIFEVAHPSADYSLGGGGRYDGMIGRFLGTEVPAVGFSLGFERIVDLVDVPSAGSDPSIALIFEGDVDPKQLLEVKTAQLAAGNRVRLERKPKNIKPLLEQLAAEGFGSYAVLTVDGLGPAKSFAGRE